MNTRAPAIAFGVLALSVMSAEGAVRVKELMRGWKSDIQAAEQIAASREPIDQAEIARILNGFVSGARDISARISKPSGADLKKRFDKFAEDSQTALTQLQAKDKVRLSIQELRRECGACHDAYAN